MLLILVLGDKRRKLFLGLIYHLVSDPFPYSAMSIALECEPVPFLGKRKEIGNQFAEEEAIGGQSKKATRVENKGDVGVGNEGDDKKEEGKGRGCEICSSKTHTCRCCPWNVRIPREIEFVPEVGANWMVTCRHCGNVRIPGDQNKACSTCGSFLRRVSQKKCIACCQYGHLDIDDKACEYYGVTEENHPLRKMFENLFESHLEIP